MNATAVGHSGRDKTWTEIKTRYAGIPQQAISIFINMCDVCQTRRSFPKVTSGKPIISIGFLTRLQVDSIDMRSMKHDGFNFIMHAKDHFTKSSWLFALPSKEAHHVALHLRNFFYTFGPPKILQSDNGKEFVANIILNLKLNWPDLIIINGRPRHPQSQGLIERANAVVQKMLGKWLETNKSLDWPQGLGSVMLAMNNCISQSTKKTPYEMVFGQPLIDNNSEYADDCSPIPILSSNTYVLQNDNNDTQASHKRIREAEKNYIRTAGSIFLFKIILCVFIYK
ncbi:unnamed protein product [Rotaria socialis]|uniref:Integrase catalytic domain-containing protein n=1 Tax=Rotaria socialis TaxID=392032 RepID=A0A818BDL1_9BILA|nr:unnamed protein product [Rotaria socialis]